MWASVAFLLITTVKVKLKSLSHVRLFVTTWTVAYQASPPWDFPGKSTGVGCHYGRRILFLTQISGPESGIYVWNSNPALRKRSALLRNNAYLFICGHIVQANPPCSMAIYVLSSVVTGICGFPGGSEIKVSACNAGDQGSIPGSGRLPWRRKWQPTPVFLPGESHGRRSMVGYRPRGHKELGTTEQLHWLTCG